MSDVLYEIIFLLIIRIIQLMVWIVMCLGITGIAAVIQRISKKKLIRWVIKIAATVTVCIIILMLVDDLGYIIKYRSMWFGIWLALSLTVTMITVIVQLINKKLRKKKPISWAKKTAGYVAFYIISLFAVMKFLGSYPGNWLVTDEEYCELAYELYNLNLGCYEYEKIYEGSHGEIVIEFKDISHISDHVLERTLEQRDYITIKTAVEEYIKENINFQAKRIDIWFRFSYGDTINHFYNFDPRTGEMEIDAPYWFVTNLHVNNFTELAEFYCDFAGIRGAVYSMEGIQDIKNLCNLTYLQLYMSGEAEKDIDMEEQYLEELNTLLPDCEIYLNQYIDIGPDWENFFE